MSEPTDISQILNKMFKVYNLEHKRAEKYLLKNWPFIVGRLVADKTEDLKIKNQKLYIKVGHAALKNELNYQKSILLESINDKLDKYHLKEIVIL